MRIASIALVLALASAGCSGTNTTPAATTPTVSTPTEIFFNTLPVQGVGFYSFTVTQAGTASVTLASVTAVADGSVSTKAMGLGLGAPNADGTGCTLSASVNTAPGLTAQLTGQLAVGMGCVQLSDLGTLQAPVNFVVRIVHT